MLRRSTSVGGRLERKTNDGSKKKQSVRFTGPTARPRRQLASRAKPVVRESSVFMVHDDGPSRRDVVAGVGVDAESKLSDAHTGASTTRLGGTRYRSSTLRRSKSMYNQSSHAPPTYDGSYTESISVQQQYPEVSLILPMQAREDEQLQYSIRRSLRAPKSMSYLDYQMNQIVSENGETKRDGVLGPVKEHSSKGGGGGSSSFHRLKSHSSMFFRGRHRRHESSMETSRSCRNSSDHSAALSSLFSGGNHMVPTEKSSGLRFTARRVSKTVKHKLSKLFGRPKSTDASGNEMGTANLLLHDTDSESYCGRHPGNDSPSIEEASMSRVTSHVPSLHAVPSFQQMRSRQGSLESIQQQYEEQIDLDQKSRITSWTNSTVNTIMSYGDNDEREFQRLSVIKENGMHVPSSSRTGSRDEPTRAAAAHSMREPNMVIDSQRVYSALMKKLKTDMSTDGDGSPKRSRCPKQVSLKTIPPRQSSLDRADAAWSPRTVRDVGTEDDDVFEDSKEFASRNPSSSMSSNKPEAEGLCDDETSRSGAAYKAYPHPTAGDGKGLSPNCKASAIMESASRQSCIQARRNSTFAPSPSTSSFLFRTKSPYRRALQRSIQEQQATVHTHALDTRYLSTLSALTLPTRCPSTLGSERDVRLTYAESFYSFVSEDLTSSHLPEATSNPIVEEDVEEDMNKDVEQAQQTYTGNTAETPSQCRNISSATSVEWKTWLSAHVSKLEEPHTKIASPGVEAAIGGFGTPAGHVRENAEIESPAEMPKSAGAHTTQSVPLMEAERSDNSLDSPTKDILACPGNTNGVPAMFPNDMKNESGIFVDKNETEDGSPLVPPPVPYRNVLRTVTSFPNVENEEEASGLVKRKNGITHRRSLNNIPTWVPLTQDGTHQKHRDQENERRDTPSSKNSTPGHASTVTRQDCLDTKTGSPFKSKTRAPKPPQTPVGPATGLGLGPAPGRGNVPDTVRSEWDAQVRGSRRMVDLFLSSRRRAIDGPMSRNGSDNYTAAFL
ncbi:hypothetical protein E4U55_007267 [Claviceps digitariae]|nr:hypothetical protein E4U55_007267 [Claviceps digitariae]